MNQDERVDSLEQIKRLQDENRRLHEVIGATDTGKQLLRQKNEFSMILNVSKLIVSELELDKLFSLVADSARQIVNADMVLVPMLNEKRDKYTYVSGSGEDVKVVCGTSYKAHVGMCGWVLQHGRSLLFGEQSPFWMKEKTPWEEGQQSAVLVPLFGREGIIGGLSALGKKGGGAFTRHDLDLLTMFANQISISIENTKLIEELITKRNELTISNNKLKNEVFERFKAENEAKELALRLSDHIEHTPIGVIEWDINFRVVKWNPSAEKIFGYNVDEAIGKYAGDIILNTEDRVHVNNVWNALIHKQGGVRSTNKNNKKNGQIITCDWYNTCLIDSKGDVVGVASMVMDISESLQAQKEREKLIEELQNALKEINTLRGILPICSFCKNVRNDEGYYVQIESYIHKHSGVDFSHTVCPLCAEKHYPEIFKNEVK